MVTLGRTQRSNVAIPEDTFLSGVHFAVECDRTGCRVVDRKSANGTYVNGAKVTTVQVRDGDKVLAGQTNFVVRIVAGVPAPAPQPLAPAVAPSAADEASSPSASGRREAAPRRRTGKTGQHARVASTRVAIGHWTFDAIPEGWELVEGFGIRRMGKGVFPSEAVVSEEPLRSDAGFEQYVESQIELLRLLVSQPQIEPAGPAPIAGVDEGKALVVRYRTDEGRRFYQRQVYVRKGQQAGSLAITTLESELASLDAVFNQIIASLRFGS